MASGRCICRPCRLQEPHWWRINMGARNAYFNVAKAKTQHPEQHRIRIGRCRRHGHYDFVDQIISGSSGNRNQENILYQDNKSTILLENNGKKSSSNRTRAINIRYFFLTDQIQKGNLTVEYLPTGEMVADYMSKPVQGKLFEKFRKTIMGH